MKTYVALAHCEGDQWVASIPALAGAHTNARSLSKLREYLADVAILCDDLPDDAEVCIELRPKEESASSRDRVLAEAFEVAAQRTAAREVDSELVSRTKALVEQLHDMSLSVRDVAAAVDISPGRVSQILAERQVRSTPVLS